MEEPCGEPGGRTWGYWRFVVGIEEPDTRLERVLALDARGLLTDTERERIAADADHARAGGFKPPRCVTTTPASAAKNSERFWREAEKEALAVAEALEEASRG